MLQIRNITKIYKSKSNQVTALNDVSIDFPDKGMVFIVGKSGSGKSTLLNILGGLDKMDEGEIIIDGRSTKDFASNDFDAYRNYHIGFIFQEFNLIDDMSVKENIAIALKIQSKGHDATTIDDALKLVNLEGLGYRTPKELSGGQRQRIAIARALVKNPNIILADEPTGALDYKTGYELISSLKSLSKEKLIIVVTHDNELANAFADQMIQISDGKVIKNLLISKDYKDDSISTIGNNIIKISNGHEIDNKDIINQNLNKNGDSYVCLTSQPELLTTAYPEHYDKIFKNDDYSAKFVDNPNPIDKIIRAENKKTNQKAKIRLKECLKMAAHSFKVAKGRIIFILLFSIIAISLVGFSFSISSISNNTIVANTLKNNDISLGIMEKYNEYGNETFSNENIDLLKDDHKKSNFSLGKAMTIPYTPISKSTKSSFSMKNFTGIVECDGMESLNLNIVCGTGFFNENSLTNREIVISDYASYEIRRTGYLGLDANGKYAMNRPETDNDVVGTSITLGSLDYKIIGIYDTNYEDYLPLLISETYVEESEGQTSSLNALKSYYYARIFGPIGSYKQFVDENSDLSSSGNFKLTIKDAHIFKYNEDNELEDSYTIANLEYSNFNNFVAFDEVKDKFSIASSGVSYGTIPSKLKENEVIISYDWLNNYLKSYGYLGERSLSYDQLGKIITSLNGDVIINKMKNSNDIESNIYSNSLRVVAIVDIIDDSIIDPNAIMPDYYNDIGIFFSQELANKLNSSIYKYDQIFFTLNGSKHAYARTIKSLEKDDYYILNIDGSISFDYSTIDTIKSIATIVSLIMIVFALLIMVNFVSTNVSNRKKEIGILRATGARKNDIIKIFAVEEGIIALVVSIFSIIIIGYSSNLINQLLGNVELHIQLIVFDWISILTTLLISFGLIFISTLIPVMSIAKQKPIDAIRKI